MCQANLAVKDLLCPMGNPSCQIKDFLIQGDSSNREPSSEEWGSINFRGKGGEEGDRLRGGILGLGFLLAAAVFAYGYWQGCRKAEILAINDNGAHLDLRHIIPYKSPNRMAHALKFRGWIRLYLCLAIQSALAFQLPFVLFRLKSKTLQTMYLFSWRRVFCYEFVCRP